ncbi:MAG TPA: DUF6065 family protein, partial [Planctomycetota bacterium]|nr:DUF6065 family protein [Planctomycetota bacterium]
MPDDPPLEIGFYQIVDDVLFRKHRTDGTGWDWGFADAHRDWMDETRFNRFAYRCLPLTIANQVGWWIRNPVGFTATWSGSLDPHSVEFAFDAAPDVWKVYINNHFGSGIITWNPPFLVRTKPAGSRLLVTGAPNYFKDNVQALTGLIESDWMSMSFTMNWKILRAGEPVRFDRDEPIFQAIPLARNPCADIEGARVVYRRIDDDPEIARSYKEWAASRFKLQAQQRAGEVPIRQWQMHYFHGVEPTGEKAPTEHFTRVNPPAIAWRQSGAGAGEPVWTPAGAGPARPGKVPAREEAARPAEEAFGGLRLRAWRLHPRAARLAPAPDGFGFHLYSPVDLDATWLGGRTFDWTALSPFGDEDADAVAALLAKAGANGAPAYAPPRKVDFGSEGEGLATIWTGLLLRTPPGWALEVRPPASAASPVFAVEPAILRTDEAPRD